MRAIGYSFETALADIIDNSIAASATRVDMMFSVTPSPYVCIIDNGMGMNADELFAAMRHGSRNPQAERSSDDLGRFGLGLKTASLSQCRRMTVVSTSGDQITGAEWDLDEVARCSDWMLLELDAHDLGSVPNISALQKQKSGTLVVWRDMDRALAGESNMEGALMSLMDRARDHVSLVFHRFLQGTSPELTIAINGLSVRPLDPFLMNAKGRQTLPPEILRVDDDAVRVEAHILPHASKLSMQEVALAGGEEGLRRNQGFYVYRNRRLITWGTWFRLAKQEEMTKLARVMVDIPNSLDHLWSLDVKKSAAHPPEKVRQGLSRIVERIADRSRRVYTFRGNRGWNPDLVPAWKRLEMRDRNVRYEVNREHDLFSALRKEIPEHAAPILERFVQVIEDSFPFDSVYVDMASERRTDSQEKSEEIEYRLLEIAGHLLGALASTPQARAAMLERLHLLEPFNKHSDITTNIKEKLR
jgi:hypothetical protein